jgi:hypothetical protein
MVLEPEAPEAAVEDPVIALVAEATACVDM